MKSEEVIEKLIRCLELKGYSNKTIKNYVSSSKLFFKFVKSNASHNDYIKYVEDFILSLKKLNYSVKSINLVISSLKFLFSEIIKKDLSNISYLKRQRLIPDVFSKEDISKIFGAVCNKKHKLLLMFAYGCGLRVSELVNIKIGDIDFNRGSLKIFGKGSKERYVSIIDLPKDLINNISFGKKPEEYLFEGQFGGHISTRTAEKISQQICIKAGISGNTGIHKFRHSFATHHLENGTNIRYIQHMLGHSNIKTTEIYTHVSNEEIMKIHSPIKFVNT
jgi:site-specific recombinase XerD